MDIAVDLLIGDIYSSEVDWSSLISSSQLEFGRMDFDLYERCSFSAVCTRAFSDTDWSPTSNSRRSCQPQTVRTIVQELDTTSIIIDSGSDATVVPIAYENCGCPISEFGDCQGRKIPTAGMREFHFVLQDTTGRTIVLKDYGFLSEHVSGPLISYGHLFKNVWDICRRDDGSPMLKHTDTGICLAMDFKNDSFVVEATIRQVSATMNVRAIKVDVPELWSQAQTGWNETLKGFPLARTNGNFFIDPADRFSFEDYPYRTTLSFNGQHWEQVERCRPLASMENRSMPLHSMGAITILTWTVLSADEIGYIICTDQSQRSSQFLYPAAVPASSAASGSGRQEVGEQKVRPDPQPMEAVPEHVAVPNPAFDGQREDAAPVTPVDRLLPQQGPPILPPNDVVGVQQDSVVVDGVVLTMESTIASFRAACKHVGISQSGSRLKMFRRLVSHFEQKQLEVIYASHPVIPAVQTRPQQLATPPADFATISLHALIHLPYEPWCSVCVSNKGRPEAHVSNPAKQTERSISVVSFDFSYTGKELVEGGFPQLVEAQADWNEKLLVLNAFDGKSGSVFALPVQKKSDNHFMARELVKFVLGLGYPEIELRCDNEGAMLQLQRLVQKCLLKNEMKVTCTTSRVGDHGDNAWVEQTVHRLRQHAMVLLQSVEEKIGHRVPVNHPLCSWSFKHAAWLLNRYCPRQGITPHEFVHGKVCSGKTCPYGETVMGYVGVENKQIGTAKWMPIIFLVETPLQHGMYHVYLFMQGCFQRLRHLMQTDHAMRGRGYAILYNLLRILRHYERHGIASREADHMTLMQRSISEMEGMMRFRGGVIPALQDEGQARLYQDFSDNLALEPDMEEPSAEDMAESGIQIWDGDIPASDQPGSPESIAKWMIRRLTRRIVVCCVDRRPAMCRYMAMRETMRDVVRACSRSLFNRSRAMVMMHEITDLSEHESSLDGELQDPFRYMFGSLPDGDHLYEQILLNDDDYEVNAVRAHGPLDARGLVESSSTIPPYVTINDQIYYTAAYEDLPTDSELEEHGADWSLYYVPQIGYRYRVCRFETNEEVRMRNE